MSRNTQILNYRNVVYSKLTELKKLATIFKISGRSKLDKQGLLYALTTHISSISKDPHKKSMKVSLKKSKRRVCKYDGNPVSAKCNKKHAKRCRKRCVKGDNISHKCVAVLFGAVNGVIYFHMKNGKCVVTYSINGLKDGKHGFHIHKCGDMTKGCISGCEHFNPENVSHGGRNSIIRHAGDLGNIISKNNKSRGEFHVSGITTIPTKKQSIIGRMIIVHAESDDLGRGNNKESSKTGNSGPRLACGVIGISE